MTNSSCYVACLCSWWPNCGRQDSCKQPLIGSPAAVSHVSPHLSAGSSLQFTVSVLLSRPSCCRLPASTLPAGSSAATRCLRPIQQPLALPCVPLCAGIPATAMSHEIQALKQPSCRPSPLRTLARIKLGWRGSLSSACSAALVLDLTGLHTCLQEAQLRVAVSNLFGNPAYLVAAFRSLQPSQRTPQQRQALAKLSASEQMMATEHRLDVPRIAHMYHAMLMARHCTGIASGLSLLSSLA